jgi:hypothetical protein
MSGHDHRNTQQVDRASDSGRVALLELTARTKRILSHKHMLAEAFEQAAILSDANPEVAILDRGYKGVAINGVKIYHPGL